MRISDWSSDVCSSDLVGYFAYHAVQGGRGLLARSRLQVEVAEAQAVLADLRQQRTYLEHRADLLSRHHPDINFRERRFGYGLNYPHRDEGVFYTRKRKRTRPGQRTRQCRAQHKHSCDSKPN